MIAEPALNDYGGTNDEKVLSLLLLVSLIGMGCHHMYSEIQGSGKRELQKARGLTVHFHHNSGSFRHRGHLSNRFIEVRTRIYPCSRNTRLPCQPQERTGSGLNLCCWLKIKFRGCFEGCLRRGSRRVSIPPGASPLESDLPQSITWECRSAGRLYHRSMESERIFY